MLPTLYAELRGILFVLTVSRWLSELPRLICWVFADSALSTVVSSPRHTRISRNTKGEARQSRRRVAGAQADKTASGRLSCNPAAGFTVRGTDDYASLPGLQRELTTSSGGVPSMSHSNGARMRRGSARVSCGICNSVSTDPWSRESVVLGLRLGSLLI